VTSWIVAVLACVALAILLLYNWRARKQLSAMLAILENRLGLLSNLTPPFSETATDVTQQVSERIVDRYRRLLSAELVLCFVNVDGVMRLAAKSDIGYAAFLRIGDAHSREGITGWAVAHAQAALVGPQPAPLTDEGDVVDLGAKSREFPIAGPLVGSRDRVWALALPLVRHRGYGLTPSVAGVVYLERKKDDPFSVEDLRLALTMSRLAGDALLRAQFSDKVRRESDVDPLTQLLTATAFRRRLREELEHRKYAADGSRRDVALFFIDTDNFKTWNDTFGHFAGDALLKRLALIFSEVAASGGFAGRNGGDEFCIALFDRSKDDAIAVAEALCSTVERLDDVVTSEGNAHATIPVTISVGVAHFPVDVAVTANAPADALLEAADARMYEAKRAGRNRVAYARTRALPTKLRHPGEGPIPRR